MGREPYRRKRIGALDWVYRDGADDLLAADFFGGEALSDTDENPVRIRGIYRTRGGTYFVKVFRGGGAGRILKSLVLGHAAENEFSSSNYLSERGILTPEALAVGTPPLSKDRAVIIFRAIPGAMPVRDLFLKAGRDMHERYLSSIAAVTAALHRASFHHRDYHGGNLLASGRDGGERLWVVDLHRSTFPRDMSGRRGIINIADMLHSLLPALVDTDISFFLARYKEENPHSRWDAKDAGRIVAKRIERMEERRLASRTRRCLMNSSEFFVRRRRGEVIYGLRGLSIEEAADYIDSFTRGGAAILKRDKKATVALVKTSPREVCVKAYERLGPFEKIRALIGRSRGHISWLAARGLSLRGFRVPRHLCLVIRRRHLVPHAVYLIAESIHPAVEMDRFIERRLANDERAVARFVTALGIVVGSLHRAGVYHRDLKATNIAVEKRGRDFSFSFLDLDAVSFHREVGARRRAKNLAQLFLSTPRIIDAGARSAFFSAYLDASGGRGEKDTIARLVGEMVRDENILYVGVRGDVTEDAHGLFDRLWGGSGN